MFLGALDTVSRKMNCAECEAESGQPHDTFCSLARCDGPHDLNWLECTRINRKKHKPALFIGHEVPLDLSGIDACTVCPAPPTRRGTWGWLACNHQIDAAGGRP